MILYNILLRQIPTDFHSIYVFVSVGGPNQVVCDSEMDIMALLVVMACAIFILFITSLILGLKVIRAKTKIRQCDIELDKSDRPKFQIPRAKLWSTSKI